MKALYQKYIETSSDHELNISHETRGFLHTVLNQPQKHESFYFNVFDFCGTEVMKLLIRTFRRFRTTGLYSAYLDHVVLKEKEVQKDLEAQNISQQPIIIEGENKRQNKDKTDTKIAEELPKISRATSSRKSILGGVRKHRKSLVPKFYTGNKHEEILSKYMKGTM